MKHPGTFNANPLSAAAGIATLQLVATGEPCRQASDIGLRIRKGLNELFAQRGVDWVAYGAFSGFRLLTGYQGPRPETDDFIPYGGAIEKLDAPQPARLRHAFRMAMLLHGVDVSGLGGMTTAAHTEADVDETVQAVSGAIDLLHKEGLA
jgi:glutamate-1-semialdehyde 2,1-aminomutase